LDHLANEKDKYDTLKDSIIEEIGELPMSVNIVAKYEQLIKSSQTNHYWATITEEKFDELIQVIAPLMKFRESIIPLGLAKFNFKDIVSEKEFIEFGPQHESLSIARYRELLEQRINALVLSSPILQKLKQGEKITDEETEQLAEELHNEHPHITIDLLRRVYDNRKAELLQFIKHILGIEQLETFVVTVTNAFDDFVSKHSYLTSRQLQFLELIKNYVLEKGEISKRNLIESPFTMIHPEGIRGIFNPKEINEILSLTQKVLAA
jgi:type I restriction enzyme R subunit